VAAERVDHRGDVEVGVGVDAEGHPKTSTGAWVSATMVIAVLSLS